MKRRATSYSTIAPLLLIALSMQLASPASGQEQVWIQQLGSGGFDTANGIAADGSGGHFACGNTTGDLFGASHLGLDAWIMRSDGAGNILWAQQIGTTADDEAYAVASDGQSGVYVGGSTYGSLAGPNLGYDDAWLARYDGAGNLLWMNQLGTIEGEKIKAVISDGTGGAIVLGETSGLLGAIHAGSIDIWVARIDSGGALQWIRQFGTPAAEIPSALAPDGSGGAFVCGATFGDLAATNAGSMDAWIAHYNSSGVQVWATQTGSTESENFLGITMGDNDKLYVCGFSTGNMPNANTPNAGFWDMVLAEYDTAGSSTWARQFGTSQADLFTSITTDGNGDLYLGGVILDISTGGTGYAEMPVVLYDLTTDQMTTVGQVDTTLWNTISTFVAQDGMGGVFHLGSTGDVAVGTSHGLEDFWIARYYGSGTNTTCSPANPNSSGDSGTLFLSGSQTVTDNLLTLTSTGLPQGVFGIYLASQATGFTANPGGSQGDLCLGGSIGRFNGPGQILNSGMNGTFQLSVDLTAIAQPTGPVMVLAGQTWHFQAWYRDNNPGQTSNLTHAASVEFQ